MPYSSSLTEEEWRILEPLLPQILPPKKQTRPPNWTKREILDGIFYQLKNGCNWQDLPRDLPPYSTVYWHYKQWRAEGSLDKLMKILHTQVREQVKKKPNGQPCWSLTLKQWKTLVTGSNTKFLGRVNTSTRLVPPINLGALNPAQKLGDNAVKNFERTLPNATAKVNLCFIRLMVKRLAAPS